MKKLLFLALSLMLLANTYSVAKRMMKNSPSSAYTQEDKTKIKKEELPEAAQTTLAGDAFKGWTVVNAYKTKTGEYEVELQKGANTQTVKFDKDGKVK